HALYFGRGAHLLGHVGSLSQRTDNFVVITMSHKNQRVTLLGELDRFDVNLRDQRTSGVDNLELSRFAGLPDFRGHPVCAVDNPRSLRHVLDAVDKNCTLSRQIVDHIAVVNDLLADITRGTEGLERDANDIDRPHYAGAKSSRLQQEDCLLRFEGHSVSSSITVNTQ